MGFRMLELASVKGNKTAATSDSSWNGMRMAGAYVRRSGDEDETVMRGASRVPLGIYSGVGPEFDISECVGDVKGGGEERLKSECCWRWKAVVAQIVLGNCASAKTKFSIVESGRCRSRSHKTRGS